MYVGLTGTWPVSSANSRLPIILRYPWCTILLAEWKGMEQMCLIPYLVVKSQKSADVSAVPLSKMMVSSSLWVANSFLWVHMVTCKDVVDKGTTSSHFKWESTIIRNVCSWNSQRSQRAVETMFCKWTPGLYWSPGRNWLGPLAAVHPLLNLPIESLPPDIAPGEGFHPHDPWVSLL